MVFGDISTLGSKDIIFRSSLEARWAKFFTELGFEWDYEPFDLNGYIPDFIIRLPNDFNNEILVEVKGITDFRKLINYKDKIEKSGWNGHYLIVGSKLWHVDEIKKYANCEDIENIFDLSTFYKPTTIIGVLGLALPKIVKDNIIYEDGLHHFELIKDIGKNKKLYIVKNLDDKMIKIYSDKKEVLDYFSDELKVSENINTNVTLLDYEINVKWYNKICSILCEDNDIDNCFKKKEHTLYFGFEGWEFNFKYLDYVCSPPGYSFGFRNNDEEYKYHNKITNLWTQIQNEYQYKNKN